MFTINPVSANGDPNYLNNGIISFADATGVDEFFSANRHWQQAYLWTTAYEENTRIAITNNYGWGVTLIDSENCYTGDSNGEYEANVTKTRTIDYSGLSSFVVGGGTYTYGTVVETANVNLNGQSLEIISTIELARESSYAVITTTIKNLGTSASGLKLLFNNYDGMVNHDGNYRSTRGNVTDGSFVTLTNTDQSSNAVLADALEYDHPGKNYGAILLAGANTGTLSSVLFGGCCSSESIAFNPQTQITQSSTDGQYAILNQLPTLSSNETYTSKWAFGGASYTTLTSSAFLNAILAAVFTSTPAPAPAPVYVRQTSNLSFAQSLDASDTLSDPDGQLRKTVDQIMAKHGSLIK